MSGLESKDELSALTYLNTRLLSQLVMRDCTEATQPLPAESKFHFWNLPLPLPAGARSMPALVEDKQSTLLCMGEIRKM